MEIRAYRTEDLDAMRSIWNEVVDEGGSFPFTEHAGEKDFAAMIRGETACRTAAEGDRVLGFYVLHPLVSGRCGHVANATYLVAAGERGKHVGEALVLDSLDIAKQTGFTLMEFIGVVASNVHARHLYERCGFTAAARIPGAFRVKDGHLEDTFIMYKEL